MTALYPVTAGMVFEGIGGFGLAAQIAGINVVWACEKDPDCRAVLNAHFPHLPIYDDVKEITLNTESDKEKVPSVDILCGGFPCQDVSISGKRAGLAGKRSGLFFEFARLIKEGHPSWVVIENVPGLFTSHKGADFRTILATLDELGYVGQWRVFDAQYAGVPQRRRRIFIVGHLGGWPSEAEILLESAGCWWDSAPSSQTGEETARRTGDCLDSDSGRGLIPESLPALTTRCGTAGNQQTAQLIVAVLENQRGEITENTHCNSLTAGGGKPGQGYAAIRRGMTVRRLTPLECERLQGFPSEWTLVKNNKGVLMPDTARYRMIGNAVAVPVVIPILQAIADVETACRKAQ